MFLVDPTQSQCSEVSHRCHHFYVREQFNITKSDDGQFSSPIQFSISLGQLTFKVHGKNGHGNYIRSPWNSLHHTRNLKQTLQPFFSFIDELKLTLRIYIDFFHPVSYFHTKLRGGVSMTPPNDKRDKILILTKYAVYVTG